MMSIVLRGLHVPLHRARPGRQAPRRAAEQPARLALGLAPGAERATQRAERRLGLFRPARQRVEIAGDMLGGGPFDQQAEIAPGLFGRGAEIAVLHVEAADDRPRLVGQRQLLMVAQQDSAAPARHEAADIDARHRAAARRNDAARHARCPGRRPPATPSTPRAAASSIAWRTRAPRRVVDIDVIDDAQRAFGARDQGDQRLQPARPGIEHGQYIAVDGEARLDGGFGHPADVAGRMAGRGQAGFLDSWQVPP